jgi:hypothetical protein
MKGVPNKNFQMELLLLIMMLDKREPQMEYQLKMILDVKEIKFPINWLCNQTIITKCIIIVSSNIILVIAITQ